MATEENRILPIERYGLKLMSMGFLLDDAAPAILRGPMVTRYTQQFLRQVEWGELDFLVLDLPPGTGDIQLTIVQTVALAGAIIVTTPQEVALIDARKAATMFEKVNVPVLGLIENMSYFVSPERRQALRHFRQRRRRARGGAPPGAACSARSRSISPPAKPATAGCRLSAETQNRPSAQSFCKIARTFAGSRCALRLVDFPRLR